ncbi:MAG: hypothetical protein HYW27_02405 [Candidatus Aenigmarchaeota archaeon]|nr:hypothetical protein [Candidatus Aenigmarchaeota archaeon]
MNSIFRSYDIRGVYGKDIDEEIMKRIGKSFAAFVKKDAVVAMDCRLSSPSLSSSFIEGAVSQGIRVFDAGMMPLGAGTFHAWQSNLEFAYITASHLPKEWAGVKFFHPNGMGFLEKENTAISGIFEKNNFDEKEVRAEKVSHDVPEIYVRYLTGKIGAKNKMNVIIDNGNGVSSVVTKKLFSEAGHDADMIFEDPDGNFPNRIPDPIDGQIGKLKGLMSNYDIGIAYDGDADRMVLVAENGVLLTPEQTSFIILEKLLKTESGPIVANVESTRLINDIAEKFSRDVVMAPVGHTFLMQYVNDHKACYGMEPTGHYCIPSIVPFDDAIATSLYAVSAVSEREQMLSEIVKDMPVHTFRRDSFECPDGVKFEAMRSMKEKITKSFGDVITLDGVRANMPNGWALLRVSNTSPYIRLTVEGDTKKDFHEIQKVFLEIIEDEFKKRGLEMKEEHDKK